MKQKKNMKTSIDDLNLCTDLLMKTIEELRYYVQDRNLALDNVIVLTLIDEVEKLKNRRNEIKIRMGVLYS